MAIAMTSDREVFESDAGKYEVPYLTASVARYPQRLGTLRGTPARLSH
jgi:hypothetical protein